jgi:hypothetical protein
MKAITILLIVAGGLFCNFFIIKKRFAPINYTTVDGKTITNDFFKGKRSIVIVGFLGCRYAMQLLKDIEDIPDSSRSRLLIVLGNTPQQLAGFNSADKNMWSSMRKYYKMKPLQGNIVADCETESIAVEGNDTIIGEQCRNLPGKIRTWTSPTLVYVNEEGFIYKKREGYFGDEDRAGRMERMLKPLYKD